MITTLSAGCKAELLHSRQHMFFAELCESYGLVLPCQYAMCDWSITTVQRALRQSSCLSCVMPLLHDAALAQMRLHAVHKESLNMSCGTPICLKRTQECGHMQSRRCVQTQGVKNTPYARTNGCRSHRGRLSTAASACVRVTAVHPITLAAGNGM